MNKAKRDGLLGLIFFAGLALLLWATQELNGVTFTPKQMVSVRFENARGLRVGETVFVLGTQSGKVHSVTIDSTDTRLPVVATLELGSHIRLYKNAAFEVADSSLLGGKKVSVNPGDAEPWDSERDRDHRFVGSAPLSPLDTLGNVLAGEDNKENLREILAGIRAFTDTINASDGSLRKFIEKSELYDDAEKFVASLRRSAQELENKQSLLGRLIYDAQLGATADKIVADTQKVTDQLTRSDSALGRLINDKSLGDRVEKIVADLDTVSTRLTQSKSTLGRLINDEAMGHKLDTIVGDLAKTTSALNNKDAGLLGALLNDSQILADARQVFDEISKITSDINSGKGALGRLINDEAMGRRLDSMIRQVSRAIEDSREAAPIGTFFQVFSGAF